MSCKESTLILFKISALPLLLRSHSDCTNPELLPISDWRSCLAGKYASIKRLLYATFYKRPGGALNKGRMAGAIICFFSLLTSTAYFGWNFYKNYWGK